MRYVWHADWSQVCSSTDKFFQSPIFLVGGWPWCVGSTVLCFESTYPAEVLAFVAGACLWCEMRAGWASR